ncbi:prepilin-type N-terminal cleavage/methylation domain-containing protein [Paenibacillus sp. YPG26]|uniref:prepilin-type N-terminal cleavage/methylation domain-containing protein n=1 Tax=Paenibacillus sp. YPG26 TaxID=2878915 RepID=UPI00203FDD9A|nr:prepilin-type N-terminal cleavage/methylation domain-containing protein [Paenibacillus sp. YPG26]USB33683.1 prepilin-type N-terminal cleavage/methylation domain-containing protein [Paenibacillus sp. YPG26]
MLAQAMNRRLKKLGKEEKGFTLIELLAVIVILGIIAIIAIPLISNIINNARTDSDVATARQVYDAARLYIINEKNGDFKDKTVSIVSNATGDDTLQGKGYLEKGIVLPSTKAQITGGTVTFDANGNLKATDGVVIKTTSNAGDDKKYSADEIMKAKAAPATNTNSNTNTNTNNGG